jgi:hypothetical protein
MNLNDSSWGALLGHVGLAGAAPRFLTHSIDSLFSTNTSSCSSSSSSSTAPSQESIDSFGLSTHWNMVMIGEQGSSMFMHKDTLQVGSWQLQIEGSKHWKICTPSKTIEESGLCYETIVNTGDMIYYPPNYWHETMNLESPSVSISSTMVLDSFPNSGFVTFTGEIVNGESYRKKLIDELSDDCVENNRGFGLNRDICSWFLQCLV